MKMCLGIAVHDGYHGAQQFARSIRGGTLVGCHHLLYLLGYFLSSVCGGEYLACMGVNYQSQMLNELRRNRLTLFKVHQEIMSWSVEHP